MTKLAAALLAVAVASPALARKVGGVEFADTVTVGGKTLTLNGAGFRKKFGVLKIYAGGLYLAQPARDADEIIETDAARRVRMVFMRNVSLPLVVDAFRDGFERNSPGPALYDLLAQLNEIMPALPDPVTKGTEMTITYVPGVGTTVRATGGFKAVTVKGKEFADAMLRLWLGPAPADDDLKIAMLGGKAPKAGPGTGGDAGR